MEFSPELAVDKNQKDFLASEYIAFQGVSLDSFPNKGGRWV